MKRLLFLCVFLGLIPPFCSAQTIDLGTIRDRIVVEREVFRRHGDEAQKLLDALRSDPPQRLEVFALAEVIGRINERRVTEKFFLDVYAASDGDTQDAEQSVREYYWYLAGLTAIEAELVGDLQSRKATEVATFAKKIRADIQRVSERYRALGRQPSYIEQ
jgi:hypothetical protein